MDGNFSFKTFIKFLVTFAKSIQDIGEIIILAKLGCIRCNQQFLELLFLQIKGGGIFLLKHLADANSLFKQCSKDGHSLPHIFKV
jgi:hypothetical protein